MYPYKYGYGQYRVIFPSVSIWRLPVLWFLTKILLYAPIEEYNVYSLGNWAMPCWSTSDALSFPLNLQYNSLPIEKAARTPYSPQSMYLILSIFTLLFNLGIYILPTEQNRNHSIPFHLPFNIKYSVLICNGVVRKTSNPTVVEYLARLNCSSKYYHHASWAR